MEDNSISVAISSLVCNFCKQLFSTKEELGLHLQELHNVPKPFFCKECNKSYAI